MHPPVFSRAQPNKEQVFVWLHSCPSHPTNIISEGIIHKCTMPTHIILPPSPAGGTGLWYSFSHYVIGNGRCIYVFMHYFLFFICCIWRHLDAYCILEYSQISARVKCTCFARPCQKFFEYSFSYASIPNTDIYGSKLKKKERRRIMKT